MKIQQFYLECLSHASYLIWDEESKQAAVIDPQRDIENYLKEADDHGLSIDHVFLTHFHADFLSGHIELRDKTGAKIYLGSEAKPEYEYQPMHDGDIVMLGTSVQLKILETPGHTPESISVLAYDLKVSEEKPHALFSGDALFIGDVGRPDLLASIGVTADELAEMLYQTITTKLVKLPDETLLYPAHGAGSLCGKSLSNDLVSTIGVQKKENYALQPMSKAEFISLVEVDQPDAPDYFVYDAIKNRQERASLEETMQESQKPLQLSVVLEMQDAGAQVVDVRDGVDYEGAHLFGAVNVGLEGKYATWAGSVLNHDQPIVVIANSGDAEEAIMRLGRIGFDNVAGYLEGGMTALQDHPDFVQTTLRMTVSALADELKTDAASIVIDVRNEQEWNNGHIIGSINIPLSQLKSRWTEIPERRPIVVHCAGGYRSAIACSLLQKRGLEDVTDLIGGMKAWQTSQLPTELITAKATSCRL